LLWLGLRYKHDDSDPIPDPTMYLHLVGILIYLTMTCPDVLYAVQIGNQFVANPRCLHLSALHCIIYYLCVGILIYLTMTCPDVLYAVKFGNQFVANPRCLHLSALHCIIYYLCGTVDHALFFSSRSSFHHDGFADANWVGCPDRENF